ncbi:MAG: hypothetical protein NWE98_03800 [Candidatus Bathyarchaeota archaeon]|nr:hypothetical protein [Candidatus Bathyarchaeota archaeon]
MNKNLLLTIFLAFFIIAIIVIPQTSRCQTATPPEGESTPTEAPQQGSFLNLFLIGGIVAAAAVVGVVSVVVVKKRGVNEKTLKKLPSSRFEAWVIKKFNGKPSDPSSPVNGFTEGGQPLLIVQSDNVSLAEVEDFVKVLVKGKAQKGTVVAFGFDKDAAEGKLTAMDQGIELQLLPVNELLNKRYAARIASLARSHVTFEAPPPPMGVVEEKVAETRPFERMPNVPNEPQREGLKPRVFLSNSNTKVADQVKKMLDFLHYDYAVGDKEEGTVPISDAKFGLMKSCDCAIINIAAAEQERRYSGLYVLNSNVTSEINAAYLKYNTQVILLVERKVDLPPNFKGLKRIEYDTDDLSFNAAMELEKALADFKKIAV